MGQAIMCADVRFVQSSTGFCKFLRSASKMFGVLLLLVWASERYFGGFILGTYDVDLALSRVN